MFRDKGLGFREVFLLRCGVSGLDSRNSDSAGEEFSVTSPWQVER